LNASAAVEDKLDFHRNSPVEIGTQIIDIFNITLNITFM
jgi:hypothetical protein